MSFLALSKKQYVQTFDIMEYQSNDSNRLFSASLRKRLVCMRQSYSEIEETTISLTSLVNQRGIAQVQKITTSPHLFCFQLRVRGKSICLYMGRGAEYQGLWISGEYLPAKYRVKKDKTVEYLRKEIKGLGLTDIEIEEKHPVIKLHLKSKTQEKTLVWMYGDRGAGFILQNKNKGSLFSSFKGKISNENLSETINTYLDAKKWKNKVGVNPLSEYFIKLEEMINSKKIINKSCNKIKKKILLIEQDIKRLKESQKFKDEIIENRISLEKDFKVNGLKVKFDKSLGHYQRRDRVLTKLKSWKKAELIQEERLRESLKELENVKNSEFENRVDNIKVIKVNWSKEKETTKTQDVGLKGREKDYDIIEIVKGIKVGVGKNSSGNDELRKSWSKKDDYWFHIEGEKGAHLILKGTLAPEYFGIIGSILRDYSKYSGLEIPVVYTTVGKVKGIKGKRGAVTINKPKYFYTVYVENWREIIAKSV